MLHKLNNDNLVNYKKGNVVEMMAKGERVGKQMIRNTRLLEVMMRDSFEKNRD